jgi:hypothetical protein
MLLLLSIMSDQLPTPDAASSIGWSGLCEAIQCHHDQPFHGLLIDSAFLTLASATIAGLPALAHFLILTFTIFETICWVLTRRGVWPQVFRLLIEIADIWIVLQEFLLFGGLTLAALSLVPHLRCHSHLITLPIHPVAVALLLACAAFPFGITVHRTLVPDAVQDVATSTNEPLNRSVMKGTGI